MSARYCGIHGWEFGRCADWDAADAARLPHVEVERDAARADADRLAAIVREADSLLNILAGTMDYHRTATRIRDEGRAALAAHDAARAKEGL